MPEIDRCIVKQGGVEDGSTQLHRHSDLPASNEDSPGVTSLVTPGNPFQNVHPNREQNWREAELTLLGMGPKPTRASDIPPEEVIVAILGISGDEQD
jgi:hypothetical protein